MGGIDQCTTSRTFGASMPIPKAQVATTTCKLCASEPLQRAELVLAGEARVVGHRIVAREPNGAGDRLRDAPCRGIDDCERLAGVEFRQHCLEPLRFRCHSLHVEPQVRPVERGDVLRGGGTVPERQLPRDVPPHVRRGAPGERGDRRHAELSPHHAEAAIRRAEIRAPLRDAVCLVHREHRRRPDLLPQRRRRCRESFGREVQEPDAAAPERLHHHQSVHRRRGAGECRSRDAPPLARRDLVRHETYEGRDHDRDPIEQQRRHLEAGRLPGTGRQHRQCVPTRQH